MFPFSRQDAKIAKVSRITGSHPSTVFPPFLAFVEEFLFFLVPYVSATLREAIYSAFLSAMAVREPILLNREEAHKIAGKLNLQLLTQNDKEPVH